MASNDYKDATGSSGIHEETPKKRRGRPPMTEEQKAAAKAARAEKKALKEKKETKEKKAATESNDEATKAASSTAVENSEPEIDEDGHRVDKQKQKIRVLCSSYYDIQDVRIKTGNRIVGSVRPDLVEEGNKHTEGEAPEAEGEDSKTDKGKQSMTVLSQMMKEYNAITSTYITEFKGRGGIKKAIQAMEGNLMYIKSEMDYRNMDTYYALTEVEGKALATLSAEVVKHPMWDAFFKDVSGCGPLMAAMCISYIDIHKARWVSSVWKFCGVDVVLEDTGEVDDEGNPIMKGVGRGKYIKHLEEREYVDRDGVTKTRMSLTYNPRLKAKMCGVLAGSFLKSKKSVANGYGRLYYQYRNRIENREDCKDYTAGHIHRMASRYAIKMFLKDMWETWRKLEGYEVGEEYAVAFLGRNPHGFNEAYDGAPTAAPGRRATPMRPEVAAEIRANGVENTRYIGAKPGMV